MLTADKDLDLGLDVETEKASSDVGRMLPCQGGCARTYEQALAEFGETWHSFMVVDGKNCMDPRWHCNVCEPEMERRRVEVELERERRRLASEAVH